MSNQYDNLDDVTTATHIAEAFDSIVGDDGRDKPWVALIAANSGGQHHARYVTVDPASVPLPPADQESALRILDDLWHDNRVALAEKVFGPFEAADR